MFVYEISGCEFEPSCSHHIRKFVWNFYRDEVNNDANENNADGYRIDNSETVTSKSLEYKTKIKESTSVDNNTLDIELVVLLKYLSNF